jgi:hypothetical protein
MVYFEFSFPSSTIAWKPHLHIACVLYHIVSRATSGAIHFSTLKIGIASTNC